MIASKAGGYALDLSESADNNVLLSAVSDAALHSQAASSSGTTDTSHLGRA